MNIHDIVIVRSCLPMRRFHLGTLSKTTQLFGWHSVDTVSLSYFRSHDSAENFSLCLSVFLLIYKLPFIEVILHFPMIECWQIPMRQCEIVAKILASAECLKLGSRIDSTQSVTLFYPVQWHSESFRKVSETFQNFRIVPIFQNRSKDSECMWHSWATVHFPVHFPLFMYHLFYHAL